MLKLILVVLALIAITSAQYYGYGGYVASPYYAGYAAAPYGYARAFRPAIIG